jgi:hypothetical protein
MDDFELTWGQVNNYEYLRVNGFAPVAAQITGVWQLPVARPAEVVRRALDLLVVRHEVLRTVYLDRDGSPIRPAEAPAAADVVQRVLPPRSVPVQLLVCGTDEVVPRGREVLSAWQDYVFDPADPAPLKATLICTPAGVEAIVVGVAHQAADMAGFDILRDELLVLLADADLGTNAGRLPPVRQPRDQVALEESPRMRAASEAAMSYFDAVLRAAGPTFVTTSRPREHLRTSAATAFSFALAEDAAALATAAKLSVPSVLSTMVMLALAARTGEREVLIRSLHSRRHGNRGTSYIGPQVLSALLQLDVPAGCRIIDFLRLGRESALTGYGHVDYNPIGLLALEAERSRVYGVPLDGYCLFNFVGPARPGITTGGRPGRARRPTATRVGLRPRIPVNVQFRLGCSLSGATGAIGADLQLADDLVGTSAEGFLGRLERLTAFAAANLAATVDEAIEIGH